MRVKWRKLLAKATIWLIAEIFLNLLGLDNLADYSEFVFEKDLANQNQFKIFIVGLEMNIPIDQNSNSRKRKGSKGSNVVKLSSRRKFHHRKFTASRSFREKFKIYTGEQMHGVQVILRLAGTVIPSILPWVLLCGGYGFTISLLYHWGLISSLVESTAVANAVVGLNLALGLLLAFRTNTAHDRFWEGRKLWGEMVNVVRNLSRGIWIYIGEMGIQDRREKEEAMRLVAAFSTSMKLHLRREPMNTNSELEPLVSPLQYRLLQQTNHAPLEIALWIGDYLQRRYEREQLNVFQLTDLQNCIDEMVDILGGCERILKTPVPLVYTIALKALMVAYFIVSPLGLVGGLGWGTGLVLVFISVIFLAINEVGAEIEEPFGHDPNDLPLDFITNTIERNVEDLIRTAVSSQKAAPGLQQVINLPKKSA